MLSRRVPPSYQYLVRFPLQIRCCCSKRLVLSKRLSLVTSQQDIGEGCTTLASLLRFPFQFLVIRPFSRTLFLCFGAGINIRNKLCAFDRNDPSNYFYSLETSILCPFSQLLVNLLVLLFMLPLVLEKAVTFYGTGV